MDLSGTCLHGISQGSGLHFSHFSAKGFAMQLTLESEHPVTDAACLKATGKKMAAWYSELDGKVAEGMKRRDAIEWIYLQTPKDMWWSTTLWVEFERSRGIVDKKDKHIEGYNICVTKTIAADVASVYQAWTNSASWQKWFGDKVKVQVKEGGTFADANGNEGEFSRVRENKDLRFTFKHPGSDFATKVDVAIADKGKGKTGITLTHARCQTRAEADGLRAAWGVAFESMKQLLEK